MILMDGILTVGMRLLFSYSIINISIDLFKYTLNLITLSIVENGFFSVLFVISAALKSYTKQIF